MKTTYEIFFKTDPLLYSKLNEIDRGIISGAMKIYAKQVAEQALRGATENVEIDYLDDIYSGELRACTINEQSILNTEIKLP